MGHPRARNEQSVGRVARRRCGGEARRYVYFPGEKVPGTCMENTTSTPLMGLNQCGVFCGTRIQSPLAMLRGVPPSIAEPARLVASVRFSLTSLPPVTRVADPSIT